MKEIPKKVMSEAIKYGNRIGADCEEWLEENDKIDHYALAKNGFLAGYQEATDGLEELEKENAMLKDRISDTEWNYEQEKIDREWRADEDIIKVRDYFKNHDKTTFEHWAYAYLTNLSDQITALQSQCTEKDQEIERLKKENEYYLKDLKRLDGLYGNLK